MDAQKTITLFLFKALAGLLFAALLLAQVPAAAIPNTGAASVGRAAVLARSFESWLGRDLSRAEARRLDAAVRELRETGTEPDRARAVGLVAEAADLWERYEKVPVVCMYGKVNAKASGLFGKWSVNGVGAGYEITPCLMLNSFNPLAWDAREFKSYIMQGGSFSQSGGTFGGLAAGFLVGIYAGPRWLSRPLVGTYGFGRLTWDRGPVKGVAQVAYSGQGQILAMAGVGGEISFDSVLRVLSVLPSLTDQSASVAGFKVEVGMYFNVREFPWFERLVILGMTPMRAFSDMDSYLANNN